MKKKATKIVSTKEYKSKIGTTRPGSMDFMNYPTRIANTLFYPNGTKANDKNPSSDN
jgi:hypothetical protein